MKNQFHSTKSNVVNTKYYTVKGYLHSVHFREWFWIKKFWEFSMCESRSDFSAYRDDRGITFTRPPILTLIKQCIFCKQPDFWDSALCQYVIYICICVVPTSGGHYLQDVRSRARREKVEFKHNTCVLTQSGQVHVFTTCHLTYTCLR